MKELQHFIEPIKEFENKPAPFKIEVFAWYLHEVKHRDRFQPADMGPCFDATHTPRPPNVNTVFSRLCDKKPARLIRDPRGYRLSASARGDLAKLLPVRTTAVHTTQLLNALLEKFPESVQRAFLTETLSCFKHQAYRAAVVMAWNLAFGEVLNRILKDHLAEFNVQLAKVTQKSSAVTKRSDFEDYRESKIIEIARGAGILGSSSARILVEKLNKRNTAAHPSEVKISAVTAEEVIVDLVENILLKSSW